ncbi:hypothetical protein DP59_3364 [Burkholderia pseudomallei]|nr:hypothetical protein DP59_3364 [Burkholderia pseudomallei]
MKCWPGQKAARISDAFPQLLRPMLASHCPICGAFWRKFRFAPAV